MRNRIVMKSLKLNRENPEHKKAIEVLEDHGKNVQGLIVSLLISHGKKTNQKKSSGDLFNV